MYVTDESGGRLLIVDPATKAVVQSLGGLASPRGVAIEPNTGTAYVASSGDAKLRRYTLSDVANGLEGTSLNIGNWPTGVVVDSRGWIWVTTQDELVRVIWTGNPSQDETSKWGVPGAFGVAYDAGTQRLYVTTGGSSSLIAYDISGSEPTPILGSPFKTSPEYNLDWLALNASKGWLYVAGRTVATVDHGRASNLWVFDTNASVFNATPFNLDSWNDGTQMRGVSLDKQGRVYASSEYTDRVYVFGDCSGGPTPTPTPVPGCDPKTAGSAQLPSGAAPYGSAANEDTGEVFVADHDLGTISVLNGTQVVATVSGGSFTIGQPWGVAYNPISKKIYVTDQGGGQLLIVDPASRTVEKALGGLANPRGLVIDRNTGTAYVSSPGTGADGVLKRYTLADVNNHTEGTAESVSGLVGLALDGRGWIWGTTGTRLARVIWPDGASAATKTWTVPGAHGILYNSTNGRLYVTTDGSSELLVYDIHAMRDTDDAAPMATFKTTSPEYNLDWLALNPNTGRLFVGGRILAPSPNASSKLWVFDTVDDDWAPTSFLMDSSWNTSSAINGVSFESKQKRVYVSSEFSNKVYVYDDTGACP